jgi:hypothetical protein
MLLFAESENEYEATFIILLSLLYISADDESIRKQYVCSQIQRPPARKVHLVELNLAATLPKFCVRKQALIMTFHLTSFPRYTKPKAGGNYVSECEDCFIAVLA